MRRTLVLLVLLGFGIPCANQAAADTVSSTNFRIYGDGLNLLSGKVTSTNFMVRGCLGPGPEAAGSASSASFKVEIGCVEALSGLPADDDDGDGVPGGDENNAPNDGDGNGDGVADSTQGNVASFPAATGSGYLTIDIPPDGGCGQLLDVVAVDPDTLGNGDPGFDYPFGMIGFRIEPCAGLVPITLFLHGELGGTVTTYRKFGHQAPNFVGPETFYTLPGATFGTTTVGSESVTTVAFTLTDNLLGDNSPVVARIVDPSGPARALAPPPSAPAPLLSPAGLVAFIALLLSVAFFGLRRRAIDPA